MQPFGHCFREKKLKFERIERGRKGEREKKKKDTTIKGSGLVGLSQD